MENVSTDLVHAGPVPAFKFLVQLNLRTEAGIEAVSSGPSAQVEPPRSRRACAYNAVHIFRFFFLSLSIVSTNSCLKNALGRKKVKLDIETSDRKMNLPNCFNDSNSNSMCQLFRGHISFKF